MHPSKTGIQRRRYLKVISRHSREITELFYLLVFMILNAVFSVFLFKAIHTIPSLNIDGKKELLGGHDLILR
ncbi:hypothetical protein, partial [Gynuella sp.]|uniref:hypothetical protein n=1 Tax=Gynuella sp. TaxID=2969146 RepID=UPI003D0EB911